MRKDDFDHIWYPLLQKDGSITVPKWVREVLQLYPGDRLEVGVNKYIDSRK